MSQLFCKPANNFNSFGDGSFIKSKSWKRENICGFVFTFYIRQRQWLFVVYWNIITVFLFTHWNRKVLARNLGYNIPVCRCSMTKIRFSKVKVFICEFVDQPLVYLIGINMSLCSSFVTVIFSRNLHKIDVSGGVIYHSIPIVQSLVTDTLIEIHIIIQDKKMTGVSFIYNLIHNSICIDY